MNKCYEFATGQRLKRDTLNNKEPSSTKNKSNPPRPALSRIDRWPHNTYNLVVTRDVLLTAKSLWATEGTKKQAPGSEGAFIFYLPVLGPWFRK